MRVHINVCLYGYKKDISIYIIYKYSSILDTLERRVFQSTYTEEHKKRTHKEDTKESENTDVHKSTTTRIKKNKQTQKPYTSLSLQHYYTSFRLPIKRKRKDN